MKLEKIKNDDFTEINKIATPILASSFVEVIFNVADQAIIGRTNVVGYASVGIAANLIYILTGTIGILSLAFSILFGQALGREDKKEAESIFQTAITLAILIGAFFGVFCILFGKSFLSQVYGLDNEMLECAYDYLKIAGWGLGLNTIIFVLSAYFKNLKRTEVHFYATVVSLIVNFVLDYVLVFGKLGAPAMGVKGAAIGTVLGLAVYMCIYIWHYKRVNYMLYKPFINKYWLHKIMKLYIPLLSQDFVEGTLFVLIITAIITRFNVYAVASYNLLEAVSGIISLPIFVYAGTALTLVTQNLKNVDNIKRYCFVAYLCSLFFVASIGGLFVLFPEITSSIITSDRVLIEAASGFFVLIVSIQIFNITNQMFKYCLQGVSQETWVLIFSTVISAITCGIVYILSYVLKLELVGVYIGILIEYIILSMGYCWKFSRSIGGANIDAEGEING